MFCAIGTAGALVGMFSNVTMLALVVIGVVMTLVAIRATRMHILTAEDSVTVVNLITRTTIDWAQIVRCWADLHGVHIELTDGRTVTAHAFASGRFAGAGSGLTLADRTAAELEARAYASGARSRRDQDSA